MTRLRGVGPQLESRLKNLGIHAPRDLLFHLPLRYEDRTRLTPIGVLQPGSRALFEGEIEHSAIVRGRRASLVVVVSDGTGRITLRFFHFRAHQKQQLSRGVRIRCFGDVRAGYQGLESVHPSYQRLKPGRDLPVADRLTPVYPTTEGLGQNTWINLTDQALQQMKDGSLELEELLPGAMTKNMRLPSLGEAIDYIHRPPPSADTEALINRNHPAQHRLAMEELLAHNVSMQRLHRAQRALDAHPMSKQAAHEAGFLKQLGFELTGAQKRVIAEIAHDLVQSHPMQRLLHGDVGSGKTVVAALAALKVCANGHQVAIVAPTELLAEQHLRVFTQWFEPLGIEPVWLSSKVTGKTRAAALEAINSGAGIVIGTHALMQEGVSFSKLGLVIVDEQHRFGVHQRLALVDKSRDRQMQAHQLIMTATPIPRTLAMTAYAGLEVSVIDELPSGRKPVKTVAVSNERRSEVVRRVAAACSEGSQCYWVCTLIEESDAIQAQAAEAVASELASQLNNIEVALVHGRMKAAQKQDVMARFQGGGIQLLVATTVIEVGVDVPNASLMIIENAERLGLAQLHQLRGRVGRGSKRSSCVLLYNPPLGELARQRLDILRRTSDGFKIAEKDLELRGPGEVLGTRQTGMMQFRVADLARDAHLLRSIPPVADSLLRHHPEQVDKLIQRWIGDAARYVAA
ncbi:MAG: ATP-dependent DNA helicase RecG [Xanthomonadales bacterium]|nr:ATP-dependent DNA helicase RecG [Gammaproteobacteria bacterium]NNE06003.1 ATP-dependent DNA helicase RecG [Xanthomonadales bacterium]NNL94716.1 ATP-dependent DNA helicase RecG [Xanthomonadales bacterium]